MTRPDDRPRSLTGDPLPWDELPFSIIPARAAADIEQAMATLANTQRVNVRADDAVPALVGAIAVARAYLENAVLAIVAETEGGTQ